MTTRTKRRTGIIKFIGNMVDELADLQRAAGPAEPGRPPSQPVPASQQ